MNETNPQDSAMKASEHDSIARSESRCRAGTWIPVPFDGLVHVMVLPNGDVKGRCHDDTGVMDYGGICIYAFGRPDRLKRISLSLYESTDASGTPMADVPGNLVSASLPPGGLNNRA